MSTVNSAGSPERATEVLIASTDGPGGAASATGTARVKRGMAEMLKGGVIMDVVTPDQAKIAGTRARSR